MSLFARKHEFSCSARQYDDLHCVAFFGVTISTRYKTLAKHKKLEKVFVKHSAPTICLPLYCAQTDYPKAL